MMNKMLLVLIGVACASLGCTTASAKAGEDTATPSTQPVKDFVAKYIAENKKGYVPRPCGFDMNRNGVIGEPADRLVGDGKTKDPDGDGVEEDILYVDAMAGNDEAGDGSVAKPYKTIQKALDACDGPEDGAEDIVCVSGTFNEALTIKQSGVAGHYVRDKFQFPKNPLMIIGWDKDGDGQYPPYDKDDEAVLDGNVGAGLLGLAISTNGKHSYLEIAHLSITNYGSEAWRECGAMKLFRSGSGPQSHVYVHDVEMSNINRATPSGSARIVMNFWGGPRSHVAIINNQVDEYASWFCRGSPRGGNFRFQNNSLKMYGTLKAGSGQYAMGWKLWGLHNGVEILDNVLDANPRAWGNPNRYTYGIAICQCAQDWVIRGNVLIDLNSAISLQGDAGPRSCQSRTVNNILIDRNVIRNTYGGWRGGARGIGISGGSLTTATVENVTITNNFISSTAEMSAGIACRAGNNQGPQPGKVTIVGNTIHGPIKQAGAGISIAPARRHKHRQNNFVIKNNIIANAGRGVNIATDYAPSNWVAGGNVYDPRRGFRWNNPKHWESVQFPAWKEATGQDAESKAVQPAFVGAASGDFHLRVEDTVARGAGVDITDITKVDFDGRPRSSDRPAAGADVPEPGAARSPKISPAKN